tara:strand:- start:496 stop:804 length:309 start_codon:yes stop_codon:yes gene_type:complete
MIAMQCLVPNTAVSTQAWQSSAFTLLPGDLHAVKFPQSMYSLEVYRPAQLGEQLVNPFAAVPWFQVGELPHRLDQPTIHVRTLGLVPLRRTRLTQCLAGLPL